MSTRRGFLRALGLGALAIPSAALGERRVGIDPAAESVDRMAFNFMCICGESIIAEVPKEVGTVVKSPCKCGRNWEMVWEGDHFKTFDNGAGALSPENRQQFVAMSSSIEFKIPKEQVEEFMQYAEKRSQEQTQAIAKSIFTDGKSTTQD